MAKHLAKKAACLIGSAAVALSMTLGAFPVYADSAASAPELGPVTSKDVVYQIITDRFYDGDTSNNVPAGFAVSNLCPRAICGCGLRYNCGALYLSCLTSCLKRPVAV